MSAIAGILCFNGTPATLDMLGKVTAAMTNRGPDGTGHWLGGSVALGHCLLRTTPESLEERQPLLSGDGSLALVMDGRLDNREALRRELLGYGIKPRGPADAELVLGAYQHWGEDSPKHLLGDFAFAVWDARRRTLFCAVDHMAARPFYYVNNRQGFAFASEEEALLGLPGVSSQPNEAMVAHLLVPAFHSLDNQRFWLRDIGGLSPAQSIAVSTAGTSRTDTYWRLEPGEERFYASDRECEEAFLAVFGEAVRCRLRGIGHPAAMMSGGMDSAGIAAMVRRLLPKMPGKRFQTYSAIADDPTACVESRCIESLTGGAETDAHVVSVPSFRGMISVDDLAEIAWSKAHPCDNSILLPAAMCQAASRQGDRVLLHGASGDITLYAPNRYAAHLLRTGKWREAWQECKAASRHNTYLHGFSPASLLLRNAWTAFAPTGAIALARRLRSPPALESSLIHAKFAARIGLEARLRWQDEETRRHMHDDIQQSHARALSAPAGLELGLTGYERVAGRYGVELRDPWADKRVVEFFLRLPLKHKLRGGWTKYLVRTAFAPDLEPFVRWRLGKEHLGWHFTDRLMNETGAFVSQTLEQDMHLLEDYANIDALRRRYDKYKAHRNDLFEREFFSQMMVLILWLKRLSQ